MKVTRLASDTNDLMNWFMNIIEKELDRLLFDNNQPIIIYIKTIDNSAIMVSNLYKSVVCCPIKLMRTLKKTQSISFTHYAPNNFWSLVSSCKQNIV